MDYVYVYFIIITNNLSYFEFLTWKPIPLSLLYMCSQV
jgi:hypothetical protein